MAYLGSSAVGGMTLHLESFAVGYTALQVVSYAVGHIAGYLGSSAEKGSTAERLRYLPGKIGRMVEPVRSAVGNTELHLEVAVGILKDDIGS